VRKKSARKSSRQGVSARGIGWEWVLIGKRGKRRGEGSWRGGRKSLRRKAKGLLLSITKKAALNRTRVGGDKGAIESKKKYSRYKKKGGPGGIPLFPAEEEKKKIWRGIYQKVGMRASVVGEPKEKNGLGKPSFLVTPGLKTGWNEAGKEAATGTKKTFQTHKSEVVYKR